MKLREIIESATAGATNAGSIASSSPMYPNKKGKQPTGGIKTKHGKLAPNALDSKEGGNLLTGGSIVKR